MNYNYDFRRGPVIEPAQVHNDCDIYHETVDQRYMLGCKLELADGRIFRYCKNSSVAITTKACMLQQAAATPNWTNEDQDTGTAAAIGDPHIRIFVTTAPTANVWDGGYLVVQDGIGQYEMYTIKSHTLTTLPLVQLEDEGGIRTATLVTSTGTEITVVKNLYRDVIIHPVTTPTGIPVGVPQIAITASYYFWAQRRGPCGVRVENGDTLTIGAPAGLSATASTAGGFGDRVTTYLEWGTIMHIGEDAGTALVYLSLE